jgi:NADPH:quinone reductase-like Zn-dependent oxidoreductase
MVGGYGALAGKKPSTSWDGSVQVGDMGCEGVGMVTAVGVDVKDYQVGDAVAFPGGGISFRESVLINVKTRNTLGNLPAAFKVPEPTPEWTAVPISALTATGGLEIAGSIKQGQSVLITGAAGGTGHIAVQWAKKVYGCRVAGTCGTQAKADMLRELGCDVVANYRDADVEAVLTNEFPGGFDLVYDGVGGRMGTMARKLLAPNGFLVSIGMVATDYTGTTSGDSDGQAPLALKDGQGEVFYFVGDLKSAGKTQKEWDDLVRRTIKEVAAGTIRIVMDEECKNFVGLEGVYSAQARMREGKNIGKIFATIDAEYLHTARSLKKARL